MCGECGAALQVALALHTTSGGATMFGFFKKIGIKIIGVAKAAVRSAVGSGGSATVTYLPAPAPTTSGFDMKTMLLIGGGIVLLFLVIKR